jgi:hypothetical protein
MDVFIVTRGWSLSALFAFSPAAGAACGEGSFGSWPVTAETAAKHEINEATIMIETKPAILFPVEPIVATPFLYFPAGRKEMSICGVALINPRGKVKGKRGKGWIRY